PLRGQNNVQGSCDMGCFPHELPGYRPVSVAATRASFEKDWGVTIDPEPGLRIPNMLDEAVDGTFKALYVQGEDILQSDPNTKHVSAGLAAMECVIVQDLFINESGAYADVFLPSAAFAEKDGTFTNAERRISRVRRAVPPAAGMADWEVTCALSEALGYPMHYNHASEIMDEIARVTPTFAGVSFEKIDRLGSIQWPCNDEAPEGTPLMHVGTFVRGLGRFMRRVVVAGHVPAVADMVAFLRRDKYHGMSVVGACIAGAATESEIAGIPVFGDMGDVPAAVDMASADTVAVLSCPEMSGVRLRELAWELEKTGTDLCVAPALLDVAGPRTTIRPVAGLPLLHMDHPELAGGKRVIKGAFDRLTAGLALILLAPVFAVLALAIQLTDPGPVFFWQTRIGKDGRPFKVCKFRSMIADAELHRAQMETLNEASGVLFKIRRDPRVTKVGSLLRRWSLDELPQLFNVLTGDMSLVGPRPALPQETARYGHHMRRRLVVKPGITGLWQVSGRSDLPWEEAERLDLRYVENWSLALDLQILWKTTSAIIHGSGAY
ncbi:MAG TPA: hypothetical protein DHU96_07000, partial [Actinobacteria bacterium]|nr:hypothetical protein [Actinomycetota bacterium]